MNTINSRLGATGENLANRYKEDDGIKLFCGMLDDLAFLPTEQVTDRMHFIRNNTPEGLKLLVDYFYATYVRPVFFRLVRNQEGNGLLRMRRIPPLFPPNEWNVHDASRQNQSRTNNLCESWNRSFNELVRYSHPTVWVPIECIRKDACIASTHLANNAVGRPLKKRATSKRD